MRQSVRSLGAYQPPPLAHERRKREVIQFASGPCKWPVLLLDLPSSQFLLPHSAYNSHSSLLGRHPGFILFCKVLSPAREVGHV